MLASQQNLQRVILVDVQSLLRTSVISDIICRMENDLYYRGGQDCNITAVMEKHLCASKKLTERMKENPVLYHLFDGRVPGRSDNDIFVWTLDYHLNAADDRRAELLKDPEYAKVLGKYR